MHCQVNTYVIYSTLSALSSLISATPAVCVGNALPLGLGDLGEAGHVGESGLLNPDIDDERSL